MNRQVFPAFVIALVLGAGGGYWYANQESIPGSQSKSALADKSPLFYRNPMNPAVTSPVPAQDEMGMDYIPVYADADAGAGDEPAGTVRIDPVTVQNIGVRTAIAQRKTLTRNIRALGRVAYDEERLTRLHPKIEGWIENLFIDDTGAPVKKDTILLNIYSPQLVTTQQEYLLALESENTLEKSPFEDIRRGAEQMVKTTRERLQLLDVPEHQIRELEGSRQIKKNLHIHSPFNGIVIHIGAREGQFVTPATELYMLADLSKVWVYADIYEYELPWVQVGDKVELQLSGIPGRTFKGALIYIYPYAEPKTRTVKVRIEFDNSDGQLKPDMFANVTIHAQRQVDAITIPSEAVVRSGEREQVFVVRGGGKFEPRGVKLGLSSEGLVQVLEGVEAGEEVVTSSQFLIDSESKLRETTARMLEIMSKDDPATPVQVDSPGAVDEKHGGMDMKQDAADEKHGGMDMTQDAVEMKCGGGMGMDQRAMDMQRAGDMDHGVGADSAPASDGVEETQRHD